MTFKKSSFYIQSCWTDVKASKIYPLTKLEFEELEELVITKTGAKGKGIQCTMTYPGSTRRAVAVCHPSDFEVYNFSFGCRLALKYILAEAPCITKEQKSHIWKAFHKVFPEFVEYMVWRKQYKRYLKALATNEADPLDTMEEYLKNVLRDK